MNLTIVLSASLLLSFVLGAAAGRACAEDRRSGDRSLSGSFWPQLLAVSVIDWVVMCLLWTIYLGSWQALTVAGLMAAVCALSFGAFYLVGGRGAVA